MYEDTIQDLKQFIAATIAQQVTEVRSEIAQQIAEVRSDIRALDDKLSSKMDDLSASVADALDTTNETAETRLRDHENRIIRLEHSVSNPT